MYVEKYLPTDQSKVLQTKHYFAKNFNAVELSETHFKEEEILWRKSNKVQLASF